MLPFDSRFTEFFDGVKAEFSITLLPKKSRVDAVINLPVHFCDSAHFKGIFAARNPDFFPEGTYIPFVSNEQTVTVPDLHYWLRYTLMLHIICPSSNRFFLRQDVYTGFPGRHWFLGISIRRWL